MTRKKKPHRFFFNHKGIQGHASFNGIPSKELQEAFFQMVELAHKNIKPEKNKKS